MSYSQFETLEQSIDAFNLSILEACFFPADLRPVTPSVMLTTFLKRSIPIVSAASEKARSEGIIYPILLEVRELLHDQVTLFSGREFSFDATIGLNGIVDFLLCRSTSILIPQAPAVMLVEAKKPILLVAMVNAWPRWSRPSALTDRNRLKAMPMVVSAMGCSGAFSS